MHQAQGLARERIPAIMMNSSPGCTIFSACRSLVTPAVELESLRRTSEQLGLVIPPRARPRTEIFTLLHDQLRGTEDEMGELAMALAAAVGMIRRELCHVNKHTTETRGELD